MCTLRKGHFKKVRQSEEDDLYIEQESSFLSSIDTYGKYSM